MPLVCDRRNLSRCFLVAVLVGTILFGINRADAVFRGRATGWTWWKIGITYPVPFCVSEYAILVATRTPKP